MIAETGLEYKLLSHHTAEMAALGQTRKGYVFDIDDRLVESLYEKDSVNTTLADLEKACNYCVTHEYIEHRGISNKYGFLSITEKGMGVVRSVQAKIKVLNERTLLTKVSDIAKKYKALLPWGFTIAGVISYFWNKVG